MKKNIIFKLLLFNLFLLILLACNDNSSHQFYHNKNSDENILLYLYAKAECVNCSIELEYKMKNILNTYSINKQNVYMICNNNVREIEMPDLKDKYQNNFDISNIKIDKIIYEKYSKSIKNFNNAGGFVVLDPEEKVIYTENMK